MLSGVYVKEWMTSPVVTVDADTSISVAHKIMKDNNIRRLAVTDAQGKLAGIITIGDVREASPSDAVTLSIWELNYLWAQLTVEKVMTKDLKTLRPDDEIARAAQLMLESKISGLPVVDDDSNLIGIITESDIFRMVVKNSNSLTTEDS